jgi:hypothetical protein
MILLKYIDYWKGYIGVKEEFNEHSNVNLQKILLILVYMFIQTLSKGHGLQLKRKFQIKIRQKRIYHCVC